MLPGLEDALPPAAAGDELCALDPRLHQLRAAAASLGGFCGVNDCDNNMATSCCSADDWPVRIPPTMRSTIAAAALWAAIITGFWFALTSSLTDMTRRDCRAGAELACKQLQRDGVKL